MPFAVTKLLPVTPTMELKNVATKRFFNLQKKQKEQSLLLYVLQKKEKEEGAMQQYAKTRDITTKTQSYVEPPVNTTHSSVGVNEHENQAVRSTHTHTFNEQVSGIIVLQDQILEDYLSVCNIRLRSHKAPLSCNYTKEASDYMSILTELITN
jgi:hypothetical protein